MMQAITLNSSEQYITFLDAVVPNTHRISVFLLRKDKTPNECFLKTLDSIASSLNPSEGGKRRGYSGSTEHTLPVSKEIINLFYKLDNLFVISKTLINEDHRTRVKNFKLKVIPGDIGFSDVIFFDREGDIIFQTITHEGALLINGDKYSTLKTYINEYPQDELLLF